MPYLVLVATLKLTSLCKVNIIYTMYRINNPTSMNWAIWHIAFHMTWCYRFICWCFASRMNCSVLFTICLTITTTSIHTPRIKIKNICIIIIAIAQRCRTVAVTCTMTPFKVRQVSWQWTVHRMWIRFKIHQTHYCELHRPHHINNIHKHNSNNSSKEKKKDMKKTSTRVIDFITMKLIDLTRLIMIILLISTNHVLVSSFTLPHLQTQWPHHGILLK